MKIELMMAINQYPGCPGATGTLQLFGESSLTEPEDRDPGCTDTRLPGSVWADGKDSASIVTEV